MNRNALRSQEGVKSGRSRKLPINASARWVWGGVRIWGEGWGDCGSRVCCKELSQVQRINIYSPAWLTLTDANDRPKSERKRKVAPVWRWLIPLSLPLPSTSLPTHTHIHTQSAPVSTGGSCSYFDIIFPTTTTSCCHVSFVGRVASIGQEKYASVLCGTSESNLRSVRFAHTLHSAPARSVSASSTPVSAPHNAHAEFKPLEWVNESTTQMSRMTNS